MSALMWWEGLGAADGGFFFFKTLGYFFSPPTAALVSLGTVWKDVCGWNNNHSSTLECNFEAFTFCIKAWMHFYLLITIFTIQGHPVLHLLIRDCVMYLQKLWKTVFFKCITQWWSLITNRKRGEHHSLGLTWCKSIRWVKWKCFGTEKTGGWDWIQRSKLTCFEADGKDSELPRVGEPCHPTQSIAWWTELNLVEGPGVPKWVDQRRAGWNLRKMKIGQCCLS